MAESEVAIFNMALDFLEEEVAIDPNDDRGPIRRLARAYAPTRDAILRRHPWNFALVRASLPALASAPAFGWDYAYQIPSNPYWLRVLPLTYDGTLNGRSLPYEIEGRTILTNEAAPIKARGIKRVTDTTQFDPLFDQLLAAELALRVAHATTGKASYVEQLKGIVHQFNQAATLIDALEGTPAEAEDSDLINARYEPAGYR